MLMDDEPQVNQPLRVTPVLVVGPELLHRAGTQMFSTHLEMVGYADFYRVWPSDAAAPSAAQPQEQP